MPAELLQSSPLVRPAVRSCPSMLGRTDIVHAAYAATPGIVLLGARVDTVVRRYRMGEIALAVIVFLDALVGVRDPAMLPPQLDVVRPLSS